VATATPSCAPPADPVGLDRGCGRGRHGRPAGPSPRSSMAHRSPPRRSSVARSRATPPSEHRTTAVRPTPPTPVSSDAAATAHSSAVVAQAPRLRRLHAAGRRQGHRWPVLGWRPRARRACRSGPTGRALPRPLDPRSPLSRTATAGRHLELGRRWRSMRLAMEHRAGQGAGDLVHQLDPEDHQPAQLIQTGRLHPGDDVVGAARSSATWTPSRSLSAWATWATLPTSVWMSTYALSIPR
jgi:hypothetical protein